MITIDLDNGTCLTITPEHFQHLLRMAQHTARVAKFSDLAPGHKTLACESFIERCRYHRADLRVEE